MPGRGARRRQLLGSDREPRGEQQRQPGKRDRAVEAADPVIERDQDREGGEHTRRRPQHRDGRVVAAPLDQIARAGERCRQHHAQHEMPGDARRRRLRGATRPRRNEMGGHRIDGPGGNDEGGECSRDRERAGGGIGAPGDRDGSHGGHGKDGRRGGGMVLRRHNEGRHREIDGERARRHPIDPAGGGGRPEPQPGDDQERGEDEARRRVEEMRRRRAGQRDIRQRPEQAEGERRDRKPSPQPQAGERERGRRDDREIDVERPVIRLPGCDEERRHLRTDEAECRQRRPVQHRGSERDERHDAEHQERGSGREKSVERVCGPHRRERHRGAGGGEDARDVRDGSRRIRSRLAAPQPLAAPARAAARSQPSAMRTPGPIQPCSIEVKRTMKMPPSASARPADPDHPAGAEPFLEARPLRHGRRRHRWRGWWRRRWRQRRRRIDRRGGMRRNRRRRLERPGDHGRDRRRHRSSKRRLAAARAFQPGEARFECTDACGERRSRRRLDAFDSGFESSHPPAQSQADDGPDDTGHRCEQQRDNHEGPEQLFQGRDPRSSSSKKRRSTRTGVVGKVPELRDAHTAEAMRAAQFPQGTIFGRSH